MQQVGGRKSQVENSASIGGEASRRFNVQPATGNLQSDKGKNVGIHITITHLCNDPRRVVRRFPWHKRLM
jgi:hypothetical protein